MIVGFSAEIHRRHVQQRVGTTARRRGLNSRANLPTRHESSSSPRSTASGLPASATESSRKQNRRSAVFIGVFFCFCSMSPLDYQIALVAFSLLAGLAEVGERSTGGISQFTFKQRARLRGEVGASVADATVFAASAGEAAAGSNRRIEHSASVLRRTRAQRKHRTRAEREEEAEREGTPPAKWARSTSPSESSASPAALDSHAVAHETVAYRLGFPKPVAQKKLLKHEQTPSSRPAPPDGSPEDAVLGWAERDSRSRLLDTARAYERSEAETAAERERQWLALFASRHTDAEILAARERYFERVRRRESLPSVSI